MAKFSKSSLDKLATCHIDIQLIFSEVIKVIDCTIVEGHRTAETQHSHWKKGRNKLPNGEWEIVDKAAVVTYKDGYNKKSKHQSFPSVAVDVIPYPTKWSDDFKLGELAGVVKATQDRLYDEGKIHHKLDWGYDLWKWDAPHFQLTEIR